MSVAPKNVQKGTRKWPHVMPARSNSGLGIDAHARIPRKPTFKRLISRHYYSSVMCHVHYVNKEPTFKR